MSLVIIPKSRKTVDPKYKDAKKNLRSYQVSCDKYQQSMKNLSSHVLQISKVYSKFSSTVSSWYPDTTPAVRQSVESISQSASTFEQMTAENFVNKVNESFGPAMEEYQKHVNGLLSLEKKRRSAVKEYDREREKLRQAESAKNPDQNKIDRAQTQVDASGETYNKLNDEYISSVNQFGEERKTTLLSTFKSCCAELCKYINQVTSISFIQFPEDINSKPKDDQLKSDLDSIKVLNSNNTFSNQPQQQSNQITQSVSTSNINSVSPNPNEPTATGRLNSTPSPAAKRLSRRISDCEYQQKRKSSSIAQPIRPSYNENSESFSTTQIQDQQPTPAVAQNPAPVQQPAQTPAPVQQPAPAPVQKPTPAPLPVPHQVPAQQNVQASYSDDESSDDVSQVSTQSNVPTNISMPTPRSNISTSPSTPSMNNDTVWQRRPPSIPIGSNIPAAPENSTNNTEPWYSSKANVDNNSQTNNDNKQPDDDTYSHVNPFGSGDENDEDDDYTRENPFS